MFSESSRTSLPPLPQLVAALAAIGGLLVQPAPPLWSSRPTARPLPDSESRSDADLVIRARLWQDPLQTVRQFRSDKQGPDMDKSSGERLRKLSDQLQGDGTRNSMVLVVCVPGDQNPESIERRLRARAAVLAGLGQSRYAPKEKIGYFLLNYHGRSSAYDDVLPEKPLLQVPVAYEKLNVNFGMSSVVAETGVDQVQLIWLPDNWAGTTPLDLMGELARQLWKQVPERSKLRVRVIGPSSSTELTGLLDHARHWKTPSTAQGKSFYGDCLRGVEMIAAMPTVAPQLLQQLSKREDVNFEKTIPEALADLGIHFRRTITTDDTVVNEMLNEMERRGVHASPPELNEEQRKQAKPGDDQATNVYDHIAVISEWDTAYGRCLPLTVLMEAKRRDPAWFKFDDNALFNDIVKARHAWDEADHQVENIHLFSYFKGIDGKGSGTETVIEAADKSGSGSSASNSGSATGGNERAVGYNQSDYLRRLAGQLDGLNEKLLGEGKRLRAVLVLGSDLYDKFLIMRALRPVLPDALYVTNNLDADMAAAEENVGTRNLIVVSPFGLQLHELYQRSTPPFRDSYQTSMYCATQCAMRLMSPLIYPLNLSAPSRPGEREPESLYWALSNVGCDDSGVERWVINERARMKPRIFETAKSGFVDITPDFARKEAKEGFTVAEVRLNDSSDKELPGSRLHPSRGGLDDSVQRVKTKHDAFIQTARSLSLLLLIVGALAWFARITRVKPLAAETTVHPLVAWLASPTHMAGIVVAVTALVPLLLYLLQDITVGEPLSWTNGVSAWPTQGMRCAAIVVAVHLLCRARMEHELIRVQLHNDYFGKLTEAEAKDATGTVAPEEGGQLPLIYFIFLALVLILSVVCIGGSSRLWSQTHTMSCIKGIAVVALSITATQILKHLPQPELAVDRSRLKALLVSIRWVRPLLVLLAALLIMTGFNQLDLAHLTGPLLSAMIALTAIAGSWQVHRRLAAQASTLANEREGSKSIKAHDLWNVFSEAIKRTRRMPRIVLMCAALVWTAVAALEIWPLAPGPARGWLAFSCDGATFGLTFVTLAFVCAAVIDAVLIERLVNVTLQSENSDWTQAQLSEELQSWRTVLGHSVDDLLDMRFLAVRSKLAGWLAYSPFIVLALVIAAQSSYFDAYTVSRPVIGVWVGCLLIACMFQYMLHRASISAREKALDKLNAHRSQLVVQQMLPAAPPPAEPVAASAGGGSEAAVTPEMPEQLAKPKGVAPKDTIALLDICITEIKGMTDGAFAPFWEQPFMKAIFFSSGGLGLTTILGSLPSILSALKH